MEKKSKDDLAGRIYLLSEMPISNGVIRSQLLPVAKACSGAGYETVLVETKGRFDGQEATRQEAETLLEAAGVRLLSLAVPKGSFLPSILRFSSEIRRAIGKEIASRPQRTLVYARNYKFIPFLLQAKKRWDIPFIYSPRAAYVAERKYYGRWRDRLFAPLIGRLERKAIALGETTIVETEAFRERLSEDYSVARNRFSVIPNCYDASLLTSSDWDRDAWRRKLGFGDRKVITYAGTLEAWYEFEKMIDLVSRLMKKDPKIFFQLFLKEDYARKESRGLPELLLSLMEKYGLKEGADYGISRYSPSERYLYLGACDAGICLSVPAAFKSDMLYLKIVDFIGAGLPMIVNRDMTEAAGLIERTGAGAIADYDAWDKSIADIDPDALFSRRISREAASAYSSEQVVPEYLCLFSQAFDKMRN